MLEKRIIIYYLFVESNHLIRFYFKMSRNCVEIAPPTVTWTNYGLSHYYTKGIIILTLGEICLNRENQRPDVTPKTLLFFSCGFLIIIPVKTHKISDCFHSVASIRPL